MGGGSVWSAFIFLCLFNKTNRRTNFPNLFCRETVHVSGSAPAHHQESSTVHLALVYVIMIGQVDGCRRQGRPRLRWMDSIKENTGFGLEKLKEIVKDRNKWRRLMEEKTRNRERTNIKR